MLIQVTNAASNVTLKDEFILLRFKMQAMKICQQTTHSPKSKELVQFLVFVVQHGKTLHSNISLKGQAFHFTTHFRREKGPD